MGLSRALAGGGLTGASMWRALLALALVARLAAALQAPAAEKPRLIPLAAAESGYSENSSVNLLCTVSQGHHESLTFDWFKDGQALAGAQDEQSNAAGPAEAGADRWVQVDKSADHSLLRIRRVRPQHAGRYTCAVRNQFGQDSSSVNLIVNGNYANITAGCPAGLAAPLPPRQSDLVRQASRPAGPLLS